MQSRLAAKREAKPVSIQASIDCARRQMFLPEANVLGVLVDADIGPFSYGALYGNDSIAPDGGFIRFEAVGTDHRNGYDIVQARDGVAFVVLTYSQAGHARKLAHLRKHIQHNPAHYARLRMGVWP